MTKACSGRGSTPSATAVKPRKKAVTIPPTLRAAEGKEKLNKHWRTYFLAALIETSNVKASAEQAGISPSRAYRVRREDPDFAAQWRAALCEGYENLEMDLLGYLRNPVADHKLDVPNGIRLLTLHRQFVAQHRALTDDRSEQEVLDSIDAMIDEMRERAAANTALLAQGQGPDDAAE